MQDELEKRLDDFKRDLSELKGKVAALASELSIQQKRYQTICPACQKEFNLLVNHFSIGLFDNLVYVKCPGCNKSMPIVDTGEGAIRLVTD